MATTIANIVAGGTPTPNGPVAGVAFATAPSAITFIGDWHGAEVSVEVSDDGGTTYVPATGPDGKPMRILSDCRLNWSGIDGDYIRAVLHRRQADTAILVAAI